MLTHPNHGVCMNEIEMGPYVYSKRRNFTDVMMLQNLMVPLQK